MVSFLAHWWRGCSKRNHKQCGSRLELPSCRCLTNSAKFEESKRNQLLDRNCGSGSEVLAPLSGLEEAFYSKEHWGRSAAPHSRRAAGYWLAGRTPIAVQ